MNRRELTFSVYVIEHETDGPVYVGQTIDVPTRRKSHWAKARNPRPGSLLIHWHMHSKGVDHFSFRVLGECGSQEAVDAAETRWIEELGTLFPGGANRHPGGRAGNRPMAETRARISAANRGRQLRGAGWHHGPETRRRMSEAQRGRPRATCGDRHGMARLTRAQVVEIRRLQGTGTAVAVARRYGVHRTTVSLIWLGKTWSRVA